MKYTVEHIMAYFEGQLSEKEVKDLEALMMDSSAFRKEVEDLRFVYEASSMSHFRNRFNIDRHWGELSEQIWNEGRKRFIMIRFLQAVASIALLLLIAFSFRYWAFPVDPLSEVVKREKPALSDDVQLILSETEEMSIKGENSRLEYDKEGSLSVNSQEVIVDREKVKGRHDKVSYNQLIVPAGKRSSMLLSDGTQVWINAGSRVIYPNMFSEKQRVIYVEGEAFVNVKPDKERPFIVKTHKMDIQVLGTSFNVSAFEDDENTSVVLVTGKVKVKTEEKMEAELSPNQMLQYSADSGIIKKDVDVDAYIGWKDGYLHFDHELFSIVLEKLSRYYGRAIECSPDAGRLYCSGTLRLYDHLEKQLDGLSKTVPIQVKYESEYIKIDVKQ